jgi:hypothetical protein
MNTKIASQIIAGIFALATTWLTIAYAKQSTVDKEKTESIVKLEQRMKALETDRPTEVVPSTCKWNSSYFRISKDRTWVKTLEQQLETAKPMPEHLFGVVSTYSKDDADLQFWWCPDGKGPVWKVDHTDQQDWEHLFERHPRARPIGFFIGPQGNWSLWYLVPGS